MLVNPRNTIYGVKRLIGRKFQSKAVQEIRNYFSYEIVEGPTGEAAVVLGGKQYSIVEISSFILAHCKQVAEAFLQQRVFNAAQDRGRISLADLGNQHAYRKGAFLAQASRDDVGLITKFCRRFWKS